MVESSPAACLGPTYTLQTCDAAYARASAYGMSCEGSPRASGMREAAALAGQDHGVGGEAERRRHPGRSAQLTDVLHVD